jgi:hypothetical protein
MADPTATTASPATPPPGLINQTPVGGGASVTGYNPGTATAAPASSTGYAASPYTVTPNQTVASQLKGIIDSGSPLMQQAEAHARDQANARGLINSTQAVTAGQSAVIGAATPIAAQDASTYAQAATNTTTAENAAKSFGAGAENAKELQNSQLETQNSQFNAGQQNAELSTAAGASNTVGLTKLQAANQQALQTLVGSQQLAAIDAQGRIQTTLQKMSDDNKVLLQTSQGASSYYNTMLQYMASITANPNMTQDQKANALNNAVTSLNDSLDTMTSIGNIPGVQSTLNFTDSNLGGVSPSLAVAAPGGGMINAPTAPNVASS